MIFYQNRRTVPKSTNLNNKSKSGLGLGIFIGKTLLEKILQQFCVEILKQEVVLR